MTRVPRKSRRPKDAPPELQAAIRVIGGKDADKLDGVVDAAPLAAALLSGAKTGTCMADAFYIQPIGSPARLNYRKAVQAAGWCQDTSSVWARSGITALEKLGRRLKVASAVWVSRGPAYSEVLITPDDTLLTAVRKLVRDSVLPSNSSEDDSSGDSSEDDTAASEDRNRTEDRGQQVHDTAAAANGGASGRAKLAQGLPSLGELQQRAGAWVHSQPAAPAQAPSTKVAARATAEGIELVGVVEQDGNHGPAAQAEAAGAGGPSTDGGRDAAGTGAAQAPSPQAAAAAAALGVQVERGMEQEQGAPAIAQAEAASAGGPSKDGGRDAAGSGAAQAPSPQLEAQVAAAAAALGVQVERGMEQEQGAPAIEQAEAASAGGPSTDGGRDAAGSGAAQVHDVQCPMSTGEGTAAPDAAGTGARQLLAGAPATAAAGQTATGQPMAAQQSHGHEVDDRKRPRAVLGSTGSRGSSLGHHLPKRADQSVVPTVQQKQPGSSGAIDSIRVRGSVGSHGSASMGCDSSSTPDNGNTQGQDNGTMVQQPLVPLLAGPLLASQQHQQQQHQQQVADNTLGASTLPSSQHALQAMPHASLLASLRRAQHLVQLVEGANIISDSDHEEAPPCLGEQRGTSSMAGGQHLQQHHDLGLGGQRSIAPVPGGQHQQQQQQQQQGLGGQRGIAPVPGGQHLQQQQQQQQGLGGQRGIAPVPDRQHQQQQQQQQGLGGQRGIAPVPGGQHLQQQQQQGLGGQRGIAPVPGGQHLQQHHHLGLGGQRSIAPVPGGQHQHQQQHHHHHLGLGGQRGIAPVPGGQHQQQQQQQGLGGQRGIAPVPGGQHLQQHHHLGLGGQRGIGVGGQPVGVAASQPQPSLLQRELYIWSHGGRMTDAQVESAASQLGTVESVCVKGNRRVAFVVFTQMLQVNEATLTAFGEERNWVVEWSHGAAPRLH